MALVLTFFFLLLGVAALFVHAHRAETEALRREQLTSLALRHAKHALLHYAATYYARALDAGRDGVAGSAGFLPCADTPGIREGSQAGNCGGRYVNQLGRLPWRTLQIGPLRDGTGECLWYVVSGVYKDDRVPERRARHLNEQSNGTLQVFSAAGRLSHGADPGDRVVAAVIAAGKPLAGQHRISDGSGPRCGGNYTAADYLEGDGVIDNAALDGRPGAVDRFISGDAASGRRARPFNDRVVGITREELWRRVDPAVGDGSRDCNPGACP